MNSSKHHWSQAAGTTWLLVAGALAVGPAFAQTQSVQARSAPTLEEVIVTAERRKEDLQETPVSVTAISAATIEQMGVANTRELAEFVPNLTIMPSVYGDAAPSISIRGVGGGQALQSFGASSERNVAIYIDGLYYPRTFGSVSDVTEIASVEVLKGPQGTLFGRNTTGGAISYHSRKARLDGLRGFGEVAAGNYGRLNVKGNINIPLSEQWAVMLQAAKLNYDGYVKRGTEHLNNNDTVTGSLQLHGEPLQQLTVDLGYSYADQKTNGMPSNFIGLTWNEAAALPGDTTAGLRGHLGALSKYLVAVGEPRLGQNDPRLVMGTGNVPAYCILDDDDPLTMGELCDTFRKNRMHVANLRLTYDINDHLQLSSLTGGIKTNVDTRTDTYYTGAYARDFSQTSRSFQQELQLNANYANWHAVGGLVYFKEDASEQELTTERLMTGYTTATTPPTPILTDVLRQRRKEHYDYSTRSWASYGQASYSFTKWLEFTGGLRYSEDKKHGYITYIPTPPWDPRDRISQGDNKWSSTDYKASVQLRPIDAVMIYLSRSKAFKAGIANDAAAEFSGPNVNHTLQMVWVNPEEVTAWEAGVRSEWFDRALRLNVTWYDQDWKNRQTSDTISVDLGPPIGTVTVFTTVNDSGIINIRGVEADAAWAISDSWTLNASYGLTDAKSSVDPDFVLDSVPRYNYVAGLTWSTQAFGGNLSATGNYSYRSSAYSFSTSEPDRDDPSYNDGYGLLNGNLSYRPDSGRWSLSVYGRNLANKVYSYGSYAISGYAATSFLNAGPYDANPIVQMNGQPRTFGVTFRYKFGNLD